MAGNQGVSRRDFLTGSFRSRKVAPEPSVSEEVAADVNTAPQEPNWDKNMDRAIESMNSLSGILEP
ncbi:MAG: hypothetical protein JRC77_05040 [Deltaproteobacteria bacterium]|nr:hypothetical protein [Deltaproteobacteria bacterium]